jgi:prephenate dehydrogenase
VRSVAIIGTGLIGGSFGLALRAAGFEGEIAGVSSPPALEAALRVGAIDRGATLSDAAATADLLFLAQPVRRIIETLAALNEHVHPDALVTDAGSTKQAIVNAAKEKLTRCRFLGGHPMAGSEKTGAGAADANLFRGRPWVVTPTTADDLRDPRAADLLGWLERFGAQVIALDAAAHDRAVAFSSHLPQLASSALAATLGAANPSASAPVFGPGLLDMTRLALSSFDLWNDIFITNRESIADAVGAYIARLTAVHQAISTSDQTALRSLFQSAQELASGLREPRK